MTILQKFQQFNKRRTARGLQPVTLPEFRRAQYLFTA
jgi:hypothetical protein